MMKMILILLVGGAQESTGGFSFIKDSLTGYEYFDTLYFLECLENGLAVLLEFYVSFRLSDGNLFLLPLYVIWGFLPWRP